MLARPPSPGVCLEEARVPALVVCVTHSRQATSGKIPSQRPQRIVVASVHCRAMPGRHIGRFPRVAVLGLVAVLAFSAPAAFAAGPPPPAVQQYVEQFPASAGPVSA